MADIPANAEKEPECSTSWDLDQERTFIENLFCQRFNFFLLVFSLVIAGAAAANTHVKLIALLVIGFVLCGLLATTLWRNYIKLDWLHKQLHTIQGHPVHVVGQGIFPRKWTKLFPVGRIFGLVIPVLCCIILLVGALAASLGILKANTEEGGLGEEEGTFGGSSDESVMIDSAMTGDNAKPPDSLQEEKKPGPGGAIYGWLACNSNLVISVCSMLIAAAALVAVILQHRATIKHNRLSATPYLVFNAITNSTTQEFSLVVHNVGIGPAIIKDLTLFLDGRPIPGKPDGNEWETVLQEIKHQRLGDKGGFEKGEALGIHGEQLLLGLRYGGTDTDLRTVLKAMEKVRVVIQYDSLYGESFRVEKDFGNLKDLPSPYPEHPPAQPSV